MTSYFCWMAGSLLLKMCPVSICEIWIHVGCFCSNLEAIFCRFVIFFLVFSGFTGKLTVQSLLAWVCLWMKVILVVVLWRLFCFLVYFLGKHTAYVEKLMWMFIVFFLNFVFSKVHDETTWSDCIIGMIFLVCYRFLCVEAISVCRAGIRFPYFS